MTDQIFVSHCNQCFIEFGGRGHIIISRTALKGAHRRRSKKLTFSPDAFIITLTQYITIFSFAIKLVAASSCIVSAVVRVESSHICFIYGWRQNDGDNQYGSERRKRSFHRYSWGPEVDRMRADEFQSSRDEASLRATFTGK